MAEEYFQGEVCGGNWWNLSRNIFGSSLCSSNNNEIENFGWPNDMIMDMNTRSNEDSGSPSDGSIVLQDVQKPQQPNSEFIANGNISIGSTLQMMGFEISSSTPDHWNQDLFHENGRISQGNYAHILQENLDSSPNYLQQTGVLNCPQIQKDWNHWGQDSSINTSSLLKSLFDTDSQPRDLSLDNRAMKYQSPTSYRMKYSNEFSPSLPPVLSPLMMPSMPNKQPANHLKFSNKTHLLNAKAASLNDIRASSLSSTQSQFPSSNINAKRNLPKGVEEVRELSSVAKKSGSEPALKRPRIETPSPSPLPTFKVRKEKLGDRITLLQQLVAPFGKTDTASVLHEAIEYIKFLHDQVSVLSTCYMKNGSSLERHQGADKFTDKGEPKGPKQDLKIRGLCLVPISYTFPVAAETEFGGTFR